MDKTGSKLTDLSDAQLVTMALKGNSQAAYFTLYARYHAGICGHISRFVQKREDIEDICIESFEKAFKQLSTYKPENKFSTWMYRVALNTAIVFLKSEKKRGFISREEEIQNFDIKNEETAEEEYKVKIMYDAIHLLSPIDKALIFYYLEDYSGKEMAEQLGITEGNCRVKLNRAKQKLSDLVNELIHKES